MHKLINIDMHEPDGTPLNDSPVEDRNSILGLGDDFDHLCNDQLTQVVTLEYLEARDRMDRMQYSV
jgi:hypothetical protein